MSRKRPYPLEFKDEAVRMVLDGPRPIAHVARELGIHETTLGNWVAAYKRRHSGQPPVSADGGTDRERELERENRKLREQVEFLSKATAFFANGDDR